MKLTVSGKTNDYSEKLTVKELIVLENIETPEYVSVSVNDEFVKSGDFETHLLRDGDYVEFLYFMGGGC
ncbi:MAG: sulfur carrier protein ThiS [Clostridiales bacterium]|jgi:sulfur carrier protein|nr:sulfur carrier protein ThiS [Clostridiales bacterium]